MKFRRPHGKRDLRGILGADSRPSGRSNIRIPFRQAPPVNVKSTPLAACMESACCFMALYSPTSNPRPAARRVKRSLLAPFFVMGGIGAAAVSVVTYLLWPTWNLEKPSDPSRLPISIGNTLFNVPTKAIRVKIQKRTGPQERVDLAFVYPSLNPPDAPRHVTAETVEENLPSIDRIFLSIAAHHDAMSPDERLKTIYPRYLDPNAQRVEDGLDMRAFRDNTPYASEDLVYGEAPQLVARCTRDTVTPGMCLSERRIEGVDLTFRFPRDWLSQWRNVSNAMDQIINTMRTPRS
ncbi:hypothetical protein V1291_001153 [Nitrobacteraceae bacterium AZCC 1564]